MVNGKIHIRVYEKVERKRLEAQRPIETRTIEEALSATEPYTRGLNSVHYGSYFLKFPVSPTSPNARVMKGSVQ